MLPALAKNMMLFALISPLTSTVSWAVSNNSSTEAPARQPVTSPKTFDFPISTYEHRVALKDDGYVSVEVTQKDVTLQIDYGRNSGSFTEVFTFYFDTGYVSYYGDHGGGGAYSLPMYGNTLAEYKAVITRLQELLVMNEAAADVTAYFASVSSYLNTHDFDVFANDFHSAAFRWRQDNTVKVTYTALGEREIVTFVQGGSYKWSQTIRTKVPAGSGVATVHFTLPDANGDDEICLNMNLLPVGGTILDAQTHPDCVYVKD